MPLGKSITPILRSFDEAKAREFYVDFLGFRVEFEARFHDNAPLYMGLSFGDCHIHLSEHFGDASPGAQIRIEVDDIDAYIAGLVAKKYKHANPSPPEDTPWGSRQRSIADPFGNRLMFWQDTSAKA